jgi:hypothetical protein
MRGWAQWTVESSMPQKGLRWAELILSTASLWEPPLSPVFSHVFDKGYQRYSRPASSFMLSVMRRRRLAPAFVQEVGLPVRRPEECC